MARTLTLPKSNGGLWTEGWHTLTITKAKYGTWQESKYLDIWFDGYPENFNMRVYAKEGKDGEEFAIGNIFRFANAGITDALESADGEMVIKMNDEAEELTNKTVNVYLYRDGKYTRALSQIAPVPFKNVVEEFTDKDVVYFKGKAEIFFNKWIEPKLADEPYEETTETSDIPF
tara:strand:- start:1602 stop:2123 length:522 start_codon:yes stop_codon:yes gene_type:complete